jgi:hypothetical protein
MRRARRASGDARERAYTRGKLTTQASEDAPDQTGAQPPGDVAPEPPARLKADERSRGRAPGHRRGQIRRRLRFLRQLRELQLRDIGGFLLESYRLGRPRADLVDAKVQDALQTDRELRTLERVMHEDRPIDEVRQPGIGGSCPDCGTVFGSGDRFCSWCGHRL